METYYTVYKITNKMNGKIYIGCHKTRNLDDNYMGSGKYLNRSQKKHGMENFEKEILHIFDNPTDMFEKEAELVTEEFIAEENTYNVKVGGNGGWAWINHNIMTDEKRREVSSKGGKTQHISSDEQRKRISEGLKSAYKQGKMKDKKLSTICMPGYKKSEEHKRAISLAKRNAPVIQCPHCGVESNNKSNMTRWHFDNCKSKE